MPSIPDSFAIRVSSSSFVFMSSQLVGIALIIGCTPDLSGLKGGETLGGSSSTGGISGTGVGGRTASSATTNTGGMSAGLGGSPSGGNSAQGGATFGTGGTGYAGSSVGGVAQGGSAPNTSGTTTTAGAGGNGTTGGAIGASGGAATGGVVASGGVGAAGGQSGSFGGSAAGNTTGGVNPAGGAGDTGGAGGTQVQSSGGATASIGGSGGVSGGTGAANSTGGSTVSAIAEAVDVDLTFSGQPTQMALLTVGTQQFVGYWGQDQHMTVASRTLGSTTWSKISLAPTIAWDGHHSIVMAADKNNFLHLSGRMHNDPLTYLRTTSPLDISTFALQLSMVGKDESSCTYPEFFTGPSGDLVFSYRSGSSGNGDAIFNIYNATTRAWSRLLGTKLLDGQSVNSAYIEGPVQGPDGYWHLVWTWRSSADAATNHDLSYARSKDLINWESGTGTALTLPIKLATSDIVDPVQTSGGMINNNTRVGFDSQNRAVVSYHKYDPTGATQLFLARVENGKWVTHQASTWSYRWDFSGIGTLTFVVEIDEGVKVAPSGKLEQTVYHAQYGGWLGFVLDEATLTATQVISPPLPYPASLNQVESTTPGMNARWGSDSGTSPDPDIYYMIRWETLDPNGDQARNPVPNATQLRVYGFRHSVMDPLQ